MSRHVNEHNTKTAIYYMLGMLARQVTIWHEVTTWPHDKMSWFWQLQNLLPYTIWPEEVLVLTAQQWKQRIIFRSYSSNLLVSQIQIQDCICRNLFLCKKGTTFDRNMIERCANNIQWTLWSVRLPCVAQSIPAGLQTSKLITYTFSRLDEPPRMPSFQTCLYISSSKTWICSRWWFATTWQQIFSTRW